MIIRLLTWVEAHVFEAIVAMLVVLVLGDVIVRAIALWFWGIAFPPLLDIGRGPR